VLPLINISLDYLLIFEAGNMLAKWIFSGFGRLWIYSTMSLKWRLKFVLISTGKYSALKTPVKKHQLKTEQPHCF